MTPWTCRLPLCRRSRDRWHRLGLPSARPPRRQHQRRALVVIVAEIGKEGWSGQVALACPAIEDAEHARQSSRANFADAIGGMPDAEAYSVVAPNPRGGKRHLLEAVLLTAEIGNAVIDL